MGPLLRTIASGSRVLLNLIDESSDSLERQLVEALDEALESTCSAFELEYDPDAIWEIELPSCEHACNQDLHGVLLEILLAATGLGPQSELFKSWSNPRKDELFGYWLNQVKVSISNPKRRWLYDYLHFSDGRPAKTVQAPRNANWVSPQLRIGVNNAREDELHNALPSFFGTDGDMHFDKMTFRIVMSGLLEGVDEDFETPEAADEVWSRILVLFTRGEHIDAVLRYAFNQNYMECYREGTREYLRYFLSKLLLKRGQLYDSSQCLHKIMQLDKSNVSTLVGERLVSLAQIRLVINQPGCNSEHHNEFDRVVGRFEDLKQAPDSFKAYEIASAIGAEIINISSDYEYVDSRLIDRVKYLHNRHGRLLVANNQLLAKQQLVAIGNSWLVCLMQLKNSPSEEAVNALSSAAAEGLKMAIDEENVLFYIQSLLVVAIVLHYKNEHEAAVSLCAFALTFAVQHSVGSCHEGVKQILNFLSTSNKELCRAAIRQVQGLDRPFRALLFLNEKWIEVNSLFDPVEVLLECEAIDIACG